MYLMKQLSSYGDSQEVLKVPPIQSSLKTPKISKAVSGRSILQTKEVLRNKGTVPQQSQKKPNIQNNLSRGDLQVWRLIM